MQMPKIIILPMWKLAILPVKNLRLESNIELNNTYLSIIKIFTKLLIKLNIIEWD